MSDDVTTTSRELEELEASLERRFRVSETRVIVAGGAQSFVIRHPASAEELISEEDFERDERLPYWADIWPSARVLASRVLEEDGAGRSLIELGCGAGLVSAAAAIAGFEVVATDYYEDALRFARANVHRNSGRDVATRLIDWRTPPDDSQRYDVVVASDVLYERTYGPLVAQVIDRLLTPDGFALVADPGRVGRESFLRSLAALSLEVVRRNDIPFVDGRIRQTIAILELSRARSSRRDRTPGDQSAQ